MAAGRMYRYLVSGVTVSSDLEIPGLFAGPAGEAPCDVEIRAGAVPETLAGAVRHGPTWALAPGRMLVRVPGIVRFLLTGGATITYAVEAGASEGDAAAFLIGSAFGILLHQRGQVVLHASGVRVDGRAVLFLGASGAGKSTLAAALSQRGYPLVADDFCAAAIDAAGVPLVWPDGRLPRLWSQAIGQLGLAGRPARAVRGRLNKFHVDLPVEGSDEPLPVAAIYALREARAPLRPGIEEPNLVDSAMLLERNAYRPRLVAQMEQRPRYFQLAAAIGNKARVFQLTRAFDYAALPEVIRWLERHWAETLGAKGAA